MTDYERRFGKALAELDKAGVWAANADPFAHQLMRKIGLRPRPPYYYPFWQGFMVQGLWFGVFWGLVMYFGRWRGQDVPVASMLASIVVAGVLFGLVMAFWCSTVRKNKRLSAWEAL